MSVLGHLQSRASAAILSGPEQASITTSINTISARLDSYFGNDLVRHFRFGSSTRGTILPRSYDSRSDIDYMVVFADGSFQPQTYLARLKKFAEYYYPSSSIKQDSPSLVLELNHIKFDLVPAITSLWREYQIPDLALGWQGTSPLEFSSHLSERNGEEGSKLKPTIRLAKIWNANRNHVFDSFRFEKWITDRNYFLCSNLRDYVFHVFDSLSPNESAEWRNNEIRRAKRIVDEVRSYENAGYPALAETELCKLIP
ncbi:MAG: nucleotidyltransferase [Alphaproteobacteria bacterium]|uniref:SMODS domain-containing nucleotidyltransferase n=1 Tax=Maricaulis alexandrii TaxID=2570354 RepID=UPI001108DCAD|nr:nucleotidyltransferase [Maricaulis alexandrii]MCR9266259.1 nucleotidyltransferase [Alphaproteobacteria bacterium]